MSFKPKRKARFVSKAQSNIDVLTELYGTIAPVTLDPLECRNVIRHLNGTNNKILNNLHYNKTFTLWEEHYFQERLEQYQTPFTVHQLNEMYTGTFTLDKDCIYITNKTLITTVLLSINSKST